MNYEKIYKLLIEYRKQNKPTGYVENHHILMKSMGGDDDADNLVLLTGREHYIAHLLLHKIHSRRETAYALWMMQCKSKHNDCKPYIKNSRMYEWARIEFKKYISNQSKLRIGNKSSSYGTMWICNIQLKENKKIKKDAEIPVGWVVGRNLWKHKKQCVVCGKTFYKPQVLTCSSECNSIRISKQMKGTVRKRMTKTKRQIQKENIELNKQKKLDEFENYKDFLSTKFNFDCCVNDEELYKLIYHYYIDSNLGLFDFCECIHYPLTPMTLSNKFKKYINNYVNPRNKSSSIRRR